jgi:hypothetical protein
MFQLGSKHLNIALGISLALALCLISTSLLFSRVTVFLWLNHDLGKLADQCFLYLTFLAEGWMWIPYFLIVFGWLKKDALIILINFLLSTILTQIPKQLFWPNISRPIASGINLNDIHTVVAIGFVYALACGYSRVYLGQHFPLDAGGGILVGITSILLSLFIRKKIRNEKAI